MPAAKLPAISEKAWQSQVVQLAKLLGWMCYHTWNSMYSAKGFPDLVLCRPPRLIFAELKDAKRRITPEQAGWLAELGQCHIEIYVWRPSDLERIRDILS